MRFSSHSTNQKKQAFTLIELLVVIAIIAVLAGLLFPAGQNALNSARKTTAKNQAVQIATAITAYETEYGRLPASAESNVTTISPELVKTLCTTTDADNNPRGLIFLEAMAWKNGKGGTNSLGFCDPFSATNVYSVTMDTGYSNAISVPTDASGNMTTISKHVGVWTVTKIGKTNVLISSWD
jgi:prepilin-type N-terminal cleavage/methylation domain-containing protein